MRRGLRLSRVAAAIALGGILLSALLAVAVWVAHDDNEDRLMRQRTSEAAALIEAAVGSVEDPLAQTGVLVSSRVGPDAIDDFIEALVEGQRFATVAVLPLDGGPPIATAGAPTVLEDPLGAAGIAGGDAAAQMQLRVIDLLEGPRPRLAYLYTSPTMPDAAVFAEQLTPVDRRSPPQEDEAFEGLDYALYLGRDESAQDLIVSNTGDLPLDGRRAQERIALGDSSLLFVTGANGTFGSGLMAVLPWITFVAGSASAITAAALAEVVARRRTIAEALYSREHSISHTLQQSLLLNELPDVPGMEIAARYVAGAEGTEVGGDWYDVIALDDDRVIVLVGDVAGRGVGAAAVMGAMRYGTHTLAALGKGPAELLTTVNRIEGIRGDFVTVACALIDRSARTATFALAGHAPPLFITQHGASHAVGPVGPPIGFLHDVEYTEQTVSMAPGATLLLCTDGLYERRGEDIDVGLERLRTAAGRGQGRGSLVDLLERLYDEMVGAHGRDDVAILAIRPCDPVPTSLG